MPIQPILRYPHPVLKKLCNPVVQIDESILLGGERCRTTVHLLERKNE